MLTSHFDQKGRDVRVCRVPDLDLLPWLAHRQLLAVHVVHVVAVFADGARALGLGLVVCLPLARLLIPEPKREQLLWVLGTPTVKPVGVDGAA